MSNENLHKAKKAKKDEFYTLYEDVENELQHYKECFKDKIVFCNCDDYRVSNFVKYFQKHFEELGLKKLIAVGYCDSWKGDGRAPVLIQDNRGGILEDFLQGDGSYDSPESMEILRDCDIVVTNPPFSKFKGYYNCIVDSGKDYLLIAHGIKASLAEVHNRIISGEMWMGITKPVHFEVPEEYIEVESDMTKKDDDKSYIGINNITWYTTLDHGQKVKPYLELTKSYVPQDYPKYEDYDAIEVRRIPLIPKDYAGWMGVPGGFLAKWNRDQFELKEYTKSLKVPGQEKRTFFRCIIRNKELKHEND